MLTLSSRPRRTFPLLLAAEAGLLVAVLYLSLDGWRRDFDVPIQFSGDAIEYLIQSKGTIDDGWWGPEVTDAARSRLGDVALVAREPVSFVDPADTGPFELVGRHGSLTAAEMFVPLLVGGAR